MKENQTRDGTENFRIQRSENPNIEELLSLVAKLKLIENARSVGILTRKGTGNYIAEPLEDPAELDSYVNTRIKKALPKHYKNNGEAIKTFVELLADACNPASSTQHTPIKEATTQGKYQLYQTEKSFKFGNQKQILHVSFARVGGHVVEPNFWTDKDFINEFLTKSRNRR